MGSVPGRSDTWRFFTNHAHVLACVAGDPDARLRDIATRVGITERAAHGLIGDLERAGYIGVRRIGRRNRYEVLCSSGGVDEYGPVGGLVGVLVGELEGTLGSVARDSCGAR